MAFSGANNRLGYNSYKWELLIEKGALFLKIVKKSFLPLPLWAVTSTN